MLSRLMSQAKQWTMLPGPCGIVPAQEHSATPEQPERKTPGLQKLTRLQRNDVREGGVERRSGLQLT
jgi:hypothetical protein